MAKENSGSMKRNDKAGVETRPDYRGSLNVEGVEFWLSGWIKESDDGKWMSLSVQRKEDKPATSKPKTKPLDEDDIPFRQVEHGDRKNMLQVRYRKAA